MPAGSGPEVLAPAEIFAKAIAAGEAKAAMPAGRRFALSVAAGLYIALGGAFMLVVKADSGLGFALSSLLGGLAFSLGLFSVLVGGAELFTGNNLMVLGVADGRYGAAELLCSWCAVYLGNLVGALAVAALLAGADFAALGGGAVGETAASIAAAKCSLPPVSAFFRAIMCNVLVCLAVWLGFAGKSATDKFLAAALPVSAFVACGFEHCIANMFFLPYGLILGGEGVGLASIGLNLAVVTAGNLAGGALFFAGMYQLAFGRKG